MSEIVLVPLDKIRPNPFQPRESFDREKIHDLANSIKESGLLQPIIVRKTRNSFQIIAGERRWRACQFAGLEEIPCIILDVDDITTMELSIVENWHRQNLASQESENFLYELFEKGIKAGRYQSIADMSRKTGVPETTLRALINAHKDREQLLVDEKEITYQDIERTRPLIDQPELRKSVLQLRGKGKIPATQLREFSNTVKSSSPVVQEALIKNTISLEEAKILDSELTTPREKERVVRYIESERSPDRVAFHVDFIRKIDERREVEAEYIETATGDIWLCPICNKKYRLIHVEPTSKHKLEEIEE